MTYIEYKLVYAMADVEGDITLSGQLEPLLADLDPAVAQILRQIESERPDDVVANLVENIDEDLIGTTRETVCQKTVAWIRFLITADDPELQTPPGNIATLKIRRGADVPSKHAADVINLMLFASAQKSAKLPKDIITLNKGINISGIQDAHKHNDSGCKGKIVRMAQQLAKNVAIMEEQRLAIESLRHEIVDLNSSHENIAASIYDRLARLERYHEDQLDGTAQVEGPPAHESTSLNSTLMESKDESTEHNSTVIALLGKVVHTDANGQSDTPVTTGDRETFTIDQNEERHDRAASNMMKHFQVNMEENSHDYDTEEEGIVEEEVGDKWGCKKMRPVIVKSFFSHKTQLPSRTIHFENCHESDTSSSYDNADIAKPDETAKEKDEFQIPREQKRN